MIVLFMIGIVAGAIEASTGGSGLISLPALIYYGYSPIQAIATSKFQYAFGALTAIGRYAQAGVIRWRIVGPMAFGAAATGCVGAYLLESQVVLLIVPLLQILTALYFMFSSRLSDEEAPARVGRITFGMFVVPPIALYDGFFGVGSASLYMSALVALLGMNARSATASTKILDLASGGAALAVLAFQGHVLLLPGLALGCGQVIGAYFGSTFVVRWGARWVRPAIVLVTFAISIDLLLRHGTRLLQLFGL